MTQDPDTGNPSGRDSSHTGGTAHQGEQASAGNPLDALFANLRDSLGDLAAEPLLTRMQPVVARFLEPFELVPRKDYDGHLAALRRLEQTVATLEARIDELERQD